MKITKIEHVADDENTFDLKTEFMEVLENLDDTLKIFGLEIHLSMTEGDLAQIELHVRPRKGPREVEVREAFSMMVMAFNDCYSRLKHRQVHGATTVEALAMILGMMVAMNSKDGMQEEVMKDATMTACLYRDFIMNLMKKADSGTVLTSIISDCEEYLDGKKQLSEVKPEGNA